MVHSGKPPSALTSEAICPELGAESPQNPGSPLWVQSYGAGEITSVASDSNGNVVWARGGTQLTKLSCAGSLLWSKEFGSQVAIGADDFVYVAGTFNGTLAIGDSTLQADGTAAYLAKLDPAGDVAYAQVLGPADNAIASVAVDSQGRAAVSGSSFGTAKVDEAGRLLWRKPFSGKAQFDGAGNLLLTGAFVGSLDFGAGTLQSQGGSDISLLKLSPDGATIWARAYGDAGTQQRADAIAVDAQGNAVIVGTFDGRVDFGAGAIELLPSQCSSDAWCVTSGFAAKLDAQGAAVWSVGFGPMRAISGVAIDANGNSVLSGALPGGVRPFRQTWLAKLDADGAELWHRAEWPDTGIGAGHAVAVDADAQVFWSLSARPSLDLEDESYLVKLTP